MRQKDRTRPQTQEVGILDIGSSKIACLILSPAGGGESPRILGVGHQRAKGVKAGVIVDLDEAEHAVRAAVSKAESQAGLMLDHVVLNVSCGRLASRNFTGRADISSGVVGRGDVIRLMERARGYVERDGRTLVTMNRIGVRLDGAGGFRDPLGLAGRVLEADLHAVTADEAPLRNLLLLIERCYLGVAGLVPAGYASALAVTTEEERRLGVTVVDIGGGAANIAAFSDGAFIHTEVLPVGGNHITYDIARHLVTPLAEAERIKTLYGTLIQAASDEHEAITFQVAGEADMAVCETSRARLGDIVRARMATILSLVRERLDRSQVARLAGDRVVLTGGASQILGCAEFAANALGRPVRVGRPVALAGLPGSITGASFATAIGLGVVGASPDNHELASSMAAAAGQDGYFGRMERWFRESF